MFFTNSNTNCYINSLVCLSISHSLVTYYANILTIQNKCFKKQRFSKKRQMKIIHLALLVTLQKCKTSHFFLFLIEIFT